MDFDDPALSVRQQCVLLGLSRSALYYEPRPESAYNLDLMRRIDRIYTARPFYGSRRLEDALERELQSLTYPLISAPLRRPRRLPGAPERVFSL